MAHPGRSHPFDFAQGTHPGTGNPVTHLDPRRQNRRPTLLPAGGTPAVGGFTEDNEGNEDLVDNNYWPLVLFVSFCNNAALS